MTRRIWKSYRSCFRSSLICFCISVACVGCASLPRATFTAENQSRASIQGFVGIRTWADASEAELRADGISPPSAPSSHDLNYLTLSAGGSAGAFGAGLLKGWTRAGTRPTFDIVSGVSTGALSAPFAFLGSSYDDQLEAVYLGDATGKLATPQNPLKILAGGGLFDQRPLRAMVERYATQDMLAKIAVEHRRGRRLFVVTTNLDAQRPVLWDMGAIAASGRPDALSLFRSVLIASASVPAIYQPVMIDVVADGKHFQEMHVDGGTTTEVFTIPDVFLTSFGRRPLPNKQKLHFYIVVNNNLAPEFEVTRNRNISVAARAYSTLIKSQTRGTLLATYAFAKRSGSDFNIANIDSQIAYDITKPFGKDYIRQVFDLGFNKAASNTAWHKSMRPAADPIAVDQAKPGPRLLGPPSARFTATSSPSNP